MISFGAIRMLRAFFGLFCLFIFLLFGCAKPSGPEAESNRRPVSSREETTFSETTQALQLLMGESETEYNLTNGVKNIPTETAFRTESTFFPSPALTPIPIAAHIVNETTGSLPIRGYYAVPQDLTPSIGIIALHGREGLTAAIQRETEALARNNFAVFALDYYEGHQPSTRAEAAQISLQHRSSPPVALIAAAQKWLNGQLGKSAQMCLLGWGDGGAIALDASLGAEPPKAVITFYGDFPVEFTTVTQALAKNKTSMLGFFAQQDGWVTPARVRAFDAALSQAGVDHDFTTYATAPGFVFDANPASQGYAQAAREKIRDFFARRGFKSD
jgi:carboxymethylenebutenolidase